jgi:hypothetical protein
MRTTILAAGCVGAIALGTLVPAKAQYYPPPNYGPPPGYGYDYHHHATAMDTVHIMAARRVIRYRVETAHPTEVRLVEAITPARTRVAAHPFTAYRAATVRRIGVPLVLDRATTTVEWFEATASNHSGFGRRGGQMKLTILFVAVVGVILFWWLRSVKPKGRI